MEEGEIGRVNERVKEGRKRGSERKRKKGREEESRKGNRIY